MATYNCDMNYELQGSVNRTCEVTGSTTAWSGSDPTCMASKFHIKCSCHALEMARCARCYVPTILELISILTLKNYIIETVKCNLVYQVYRL